MINANGSASRRWIAASCVLVTMCGCASRPQFLSKNHKKADAARQTEFDPDVEFRDFKPKDTAEFYADFGKVHASAKNFERAAEFLRSAIAVDSKYAPAYAALAQLYTAQEQPAAALDVLKVAVEQCPKSPEVWNEIGVAHARLGDYEQAIDAMRTTLRYSPNSPNYIDNYAGILASAGQYDKSYSEYRKVYSAADARYRVAGVLYSQGNRQASLQQLSLALRDDPNHEKSAQMYQQLAGNINPVMQAGHQGHTRGAGPVTNAQYLR